MPESELRRHCYFDLFDLLTGERAHVPEPLTFGEALRENDCLRAKSNPFLLLPLMGCDYDMRKVAA